MCIVYKSVVKEKELSDGQLSFFWLYIWERKAML